MYRLLCSIYLILLAIIMTTSILIINDKNIQIKQLQKENYELEQSNIEYRWQLEQVPLIFESVKDSWCEK